MNNKRLGELVEENKKLKETNELVNSTMCFLILWEDVYYEQAIKKEEPKEVTKYIEVIKRFIAETKSNLEKFYNITIK